MSREQNRIDFPIATAMFDEARAIWPDAIVRWASENGREIGKRPTLEPDCFEMSAESIVLLNELNARITARDAKGKRWK